MKYLRIGQSFSNPNPKGFLVTMHLISCRYVTSKMGFSILLYFNAEFRTKGPIGVPPLSGEV